MLRLSSVAIALVFAGATLAQTPEADLQFSGQVRLQWDARQANSTGPLAAANTLALGSAALASNGASLETELHSSGNGWSASATLQQQTQQGVAAQSRAWFNELVAMHDAGPWQFSAGKKIVAWDVGYAFRPNDVVQQEERRTLVSALAEGRPVLIAEHFDADTAGSWVWVNPTQPRSERGAKEPALAARLYQRQGSMDWHGFARVGAHTGASLGGALAWVANDGLELHASARYLSRADSLALAGFATGMQRTDPWQPAALRHVTQALIGGTWTHASQLSLLAEAWWDGTALSDSQWQSWRTRNAMLATLATMGAPASATARNLAWQSDAFGAASSLHRGNAYGRVSWEHEGWQPTLDLLFHPADRGRMLTAALLHKADRMQWQCGLRTNGGRRGAILAQLPMRQQAYLAAAWLF